MGVGCKIIFHVMYCAKPCVHSASGASMPIFGGATTVGKQQCEFCIAVKPKFD
jgi:hypothetical protein